MKLRVEVPNEWLIPLPWLVWPPPPPRAQAWPIAWLGMVSGSQAGARTQREHRFSCSFRFLAFLSSVSLLQARISRRAIFVPNVVVVVAARA